MIVKFLGLVYALFLYKFLKSAIGVDRPKLPLLLKLEPSMVVSSTFSLKSFGLRPKISRLTAELYIMRWFTALDESMNGMSTPLSI